MVHQNDPQIYLQGLVMVFSCFVFFESNLFIGPRTRKSSVCVCMCVDGCECACLCVQAFAHTCIGQNRMSGSTSVDDLFSEAHYFG